MLCCELCGRCGDDAYFEKHHLIPASGRKGSPTIVVDYQCGDIIHRLFTNRELKQRYNTLEALLRSPEIQRWVQWVMKRPLERRIPMTPPGRYTTIKKRVR